VSLVLGTSILSVIIHCVYAVAFSTPVMVRSFMKNVVAERYRHIDFTRAKRGPVVKLEPSKTKISIRLGNAVLEHFRNLVAKAGGGNY
jgi:uncharacterized protein (DUF4415 family)